MKKLFGLLLLILTIHFGYGQNNIPRVNSKSFPTNIDKTIFEKLKKLDGEIVAFDGTIDKIETSRNNTPFYKLKLDDNSYLWTVLMFNNDSNKIGDTIRVVGYLRPTPEKSEQDKLESKYLDGKYMVISFGLVDFKNSNFLFSGGAKVQKQEWIDGKIPSSK
jgi:hypothetical protein